MSSARPIWKNPAAASFAIIQPTRDRELAQSFHSAIFPNFAKTPLVPLPNLAAELGLKAVFVKDESSRLGLPAFKILGASWGVYRAVAERLGLDLMTDFEELGVQARKAGIQLVAATDGNHGRAVARMAKLLGIEADIYIPHVTDQATEQFIASEGATVVRISSDYDAAVSAAAEAASPAPTRLLIQDTSFPGYEQVPRWIVDGYSTLLAEVEDMFAFDHLKTSTIITPVGVGSLAHAVVVFAKSYLRAIRVIAVEPERSACLHRALRSGDHTNPISTTNTIMAGMNCGTVSPVSWPLLRQGVDVSVTVSEREAHEAVQYLQSHGIEAGPCGAATLAALRRVVAVEGEEGGGRGGNEERVLGKDDVVVLLSTEGKREYIMPGKVPLVD